MPPKNNAPQAVNAYFERFSTVAPLAYARCAAVAPSKNRFQIRCLRCNTVLPSENAVSQGERAKSYCAVRQVRSTQNSDVCADKTLRRIVLRRRFRKCCPKTFRAYYTHFYNTVNKFCSPP